MTGNPTNPKVHAIRSILDGQKSQRDSLHAEHEKLETDLQLISATIHVLDSSIANFEDSLQQMGVDSSNTPTSCSFRFSEENTLDLLKHSNVENGIQAKHLVSAYQERGVKTHNRAVLQHIESLMQVNLVTQANPEARRGRLYKWVKEQTPAVPGLVSGE